MTHQGQLFYWPASGSQVTNNILLQQPRDHSWVMFAAQTGPLSKYLSPGFYASLSINTCLGLTCNSEVRQ